MQPSPLVQRSGRRPTCCWTTATSAGVGVVSTRHAVQMRRSSRWPITALSDDATRNGSMPMSVNRWTAAAASTACSEDSTRWPVREACMAMRAVSSSRISPTRMMSGSWRRMPRRPSANEMPASDTCIWLTPAKWYSTGSSMVTTLRVGSLISLRVAYSVVVLPDPVGPVHSTMPSGALATPRNGSTTSLRMPRSRRLIRLRVVSSSRSTTFSPWMVPTMEARMSMGRPSTDAWNWPSWGRRRSTMLSSAITLIRLAMGDAICAGSMIASDSAPSTR